MLTLPLPGTRITMSKNRNRFKSSEKSVLKDFFECFHPSNIGYHLGGDMLKMNPLLEDKLPLLFDELLKEGIVSGSYENFIQRAKEIKRREILREESEFYLL